MVTGDFRRFWLGHTVSATGTQISIVALPLIAALTLGTGAAGVSALATATFLPNVILPLLAGHWLERRRRRPVMIAANLVRAAAIGVIPVAYLAGFLSLPLLIGVALVVGAASVVFDIGGFAYLPTLVEEKQLHRANRAMQGSTTAAQVAGPGAAGLIVQALGAPLAMLFDAIGYLASALGILAVRRPEPAPAPQAKGSVLEGLRLLAVNPYLRALTAHASIYNLSGQIFAVNLVILAVTDRGLSPGLYGAALSAAGIGAFLGTMAALNLSARLGFGRAFVVALGFYAATPVLLLLVPGQAVPFAIGLGVLQLLSGFGLGCGQVLSTTLRQIVVPAGSLARSIGGYRLVIYGVLPIGALLGGVIGSRLGATAGVAVGALGFVLSALPMLAPRVRTLHTPVAPPTAAAAPIEPVTVS